MDIIIAGDRERENLFAEIHVDGQPWAEVIFDDATRTYALTIFAGDEPQWLTFDLARVQQALLAARDALVARGYPDVGA